ncbi:hypothetical protein GmHk_18G052105 [Glycine max]|nr:hypothetical protein GmHk_18G052105 [Glycine max]
MGSTGNGALDPPFVIMVRTKGLGQALGRILGRALGREVSVDADKAPQWQMLTTSARRQREVAPVAEDVEQVDHAANDVHEQLEKAVDDDVVADAKGFPSRPHDSSVLMDYVHHVAITERLELKLSSRGRKVEKLGRPTPKIEGLVANIGLSPLIACSLDIDDRGLISTFAKRWHKETTSFHLSCWIYDHFPTVASSIIVKDYHERKPCACRWKSRKALLVSTYPKRWIPFSKYHAAVGQICVVPGQCAADYMEWFYMISHSFMSPMQARDPPRHPPMVHNETFIELDPPQQSVATTVMVEPPVVALGNVDMPRHALV